MESLSDKKKRIRQARGEEPADLVLKNCRVINVFCGEIISGDIAICGECIAGVGNYSGYEEIDCRGAYVSPGFMEAHIHIESSMLTPEQFVRTVLPHGTTSVVCDPHEIANVAGAEGLEYFMESGSGLPCSVFLMTPSCVPATHLENGGAILSAKDIEKILKNPEVLGLAEMMNFPGVLFQDEEVLKKIEAAEKMNLPVDGHAPGLTGSDLQAYVGSGIASDHECTTTEEALEKLRSGMYIFIREGSTARNLEALLPVVNPGNSRRCILVTDDCHPHDLLESGHLDRILRKAVSLGADPVTAIQMVTINVADYYGLRNRGAVAAGYRADLVLFDDLQNITPHTVYAAGASVDKMDFTASAGRVDWQKRFPKVFDSVHVKEDGISFAIPAGGADIRVIKIIKDQLITDSVILPAKIEEGFAVADEKRDLAKLAVVERHHKTGNMGLGFVQGIGLAAGALASTVGHDSHNITVLGMNDHDMEVAVQTLIGMGGGLAVVSAGKVLGKLPLNVAGLMSTSDAKEVAGSFADILHAAYTLGVKVDDPFMLMSFLVLPVIPHLKMTDLGLVDVDTFSHVDLWI